MRPFEGKWNNVKEAVNEILGFVYTILYIMLTDLTLGSNQFTSSTERELFATCIVGVIFVAGGIGLCIFGYTYLMLFKKKSILLITKISQKLKENREKKWALL